MFAELMKLSPRNIARRAASVVAPAWLEDSNASEMGAADDGGPAKSIAEFLSRHDDFEIDARYCDQYGQNVTGNPNGYLRKK
jgi:cephalosporin hydroxylase